MECPVIANKEFVITAETIEALSLNTYERVVGTTVKITCLSNTTHKLVGADTLKCLSTGQWDNPIPICISKSSNVPDGFDQTSTVTTPSTEEYAMLPLIVALALLGTACICLIILLGYMLHLIRKADNLSTLLEDNREDQSTSYRSQDTFQAPTTLSSNKRADMFYSYPDSLRPAFSFSQYQTDIPGEPAVQRETMVESLRYTHLSDGWSGY